jgi:serine/threonine protein kinase
MSFSFFDMELCDVTLEDWIKGDWPKDLEEDSRYFSVNDGRLTQVLHLAEEIINGIAFIHSQQEIHRDLKPRNSKFHCKLLTYSKYSIRWHKRRGRLQISVSPWGVLLL